MIFLGIVLGVIAFAAKLFFDLRREKNLKLAVSEFINSSKIFSDAVNQNLEKIECSEHRESQKVLFSPEEDFASIAEWPIFESNNPKNEIRIIDIEALFFEYHNSKESNSIFWEYARSVKGKNEWKTIPDLFKESYLNVEDDLSKSIYSTFIDRKYAHQTLRKTVKGHFLNNVFFGESKETFGVEKDFIDYELDNRIKLTY